MSTEPSSVTPSPALVYTRADFALALGMGLRTFDRLRATDPTFPAPIRLAGPKDRPRWLRSQAQAWLNEKAMSQEMGGPQ